MMEMPRGRKGGRAHECRQNKCLAAGLATRAAGPPNSDMIVIEAPATAQSGLTCRGLTEYFVKVRQERRTR